MTILEPRRWRSSAGGCMTSSPSLAREGLGLLVKHHEAAFHRGLVRDELEVSGRAGSCTISSMDPKLRSRRRGRTRGNGALERVKVVHEPEVRTHRSMPSRLNAVGDTKYTGISLVRKNLRISETPRSGACDVFTSPDSPGCVGGRTMPRPRRPTNRRFARGPLQQYRGIKPIDRMM